MTKFALDKTKIIILALLIIIIGGISAYHKMPRAEDPGYIVRAAVVTTVFPGANPERVELLVTDKIEEAIQEMPEIDFIKSKSKTGLSVIYVNILEKYKNIRPIWDKLRRKVEKAQSQLPENARPSVVNDEYGDVFGSIVTLTGEGYSYRELKDIAKEVRDEFLRIKDVAKVDIKGDQQEVVFLEYSNVNLSKLGLSPYQLKKLLLERNILISGGAIKVGDERIVFEPSGNYESIDDIKKTVIQLEKTKDVVFLGDIVKVKRGYIDPPEKIVHSSGKRAIMLAISLKENGNIINLGKELKLKIQELKNIYPIGVEFDIVSFQPDYVKKLTDGFVINLIQSIVVVVILMLAILGVCVGTLVASLIPISILMAFLIMNQLDIGIDKISLAALIIALGMLVDNAIVMSESIMVKIEEGLRKRDAILKSAQELKKPLLIATLATSAAFLPIYLAESSAGEYCASLFKVVFITLISSWVLSLTMIPMFCNMFLEESKTRLEQDFFTSKVYSTYRDWLIILLKNPKKTLISVALIFLITFGIFKVFIPKKFFPYSDRKTFQIELKAPFGTAIESTEEIVNEIEKFFEKNLMATKKRKGIVNWSAFIGEGFPRYVLSAYPKAPDPSYAAFIVNTNSFEKLDEFMCKTRDFCKASFPDVNVVVSRVPLGPPYEAPVEIRVSGKHKDKVFEYVEKIKEKLKSIKGSSQVVDDWGIKTKRINVNIDSSKAHRAGVTNRDIAVSLQSAFSGFEISQYREGDKLVPIIYRTTENYRDDLGKIETLYVHSELTGACVPLKQVADISVQWEYPEIKRRDSYQTITVQSELKGKTTAKSLVEKITPWLKKESEKWPNGYFWEIGGSAEKSSSSNKSINEKLPIAGLVILILMMINFNSFQKVTIVFLNSPLALIGSFIGLWLTRSYFGFITFLGVISLFGIVANNAVVLLDRIDIEEANHPDEPERALVVASQKRLRPIVLTATTTIGGLSPLWFSNDPMFSPMAITIIFGLLAAVFFTLLIVPVFYSIFYKLDFKDFVY